MTGWSRPKALDFPTVWSTFVGKREHNGKKRNYWIQDITADYVEEVVKYMTTEFVYEEALCKYSGLANDAASLKEFEHIWRELLDHKVGLICLTKGEDGVAEIAGINCCYICSNGENFKPQTKIATQVYEACKYLMDRVDVFEKFGVQHYLTAMGLYVPSRFRGEGIGLELLKARKPFCAALDLDTTLTIFTTEASQILAERTGFKDLVSMPYEDFVKADENFKFPGIEQAAKNIRFMYLIY